MAQVIQLPKMSESKPRGKYKDLRSREHLLEHEINELISAAKGSRYPHRDSTLIMMMFRHGLRVSEASALRWDQIDFKTGTIVINRAKKGRPSTHPLRGPEIRALRQLKRDSEQSPYVFLTERNTCLAKNTIYDVVRNAGKRAGFSFPIHPHMLRHSVGYYLANKGMDTRAIQAYLGHANIQHTVRYTELAPNRFNDFFQD